MQNKNIIWTFSILLTLACLYQLSFTWVTSGVESDAKTHAEIELAKYTLGDTSKIKVGNLFMPIKTKQQRSYFKIKTEEQYLIEISGKPVYPLLGHSYKYCKDNELAKGLDLEGGMSVTLKVSIPDMIKNLAGRYGKKSSFTEPYNAAMKTFSTKENEIDFVTLFQTEFNKVSKDENLAKVFKFKDENSKTMTDISNEKVFEMLRTKAEGALEKTATVINTRLSSFGLNQPTIQLNQAKGTISIEMPGVKDKDRMRGLIQGMAKLEFWHTYKNTEVGNAVYEKVDKILSTTYYPGFADSLEKIKNDTLDGNDSTDIINKIVDANDSIKLNDSAVEDDFVNDTAFPSSYNNGLEGLSQEERIENGKKTNPLSAYLYPYVNSKGEWSEGPILGYAKISDTAIIDSFLRQTFVINELPVRDLAFMWESKPDPKAVTQDGTPLINLYLIKKTKKGTPQLDGEEVETARQDFDQNSLPAVSLQFKKQGANAWADLTEVSAERQTGIAITLDNKVFSAPIASGKIEGGNTQITGGSFNGENGIKEAESLAKILKAGALPAPATIVDESFVGPTMGKENVKKGLLSFAGALLLVLVYMVFYYAKAGAVADVALVANIFFIFGTLASLGAALTLPGIAGIVLTIGMSVDANVLVFERIREELRKGRGNKQSIKEGYSKALSAILDANVTTLLTAIVLGYFGTGPIKGFATTLIIGIFTSLFSALIITRLIFAYMMESKKEISFSTKMTENFLTKANFQFVAKRKMFYALSGLIILGGIASLATRGLDLGVEFSGGRTYKVEFTEKVDLTKVRTSLKGVFDDVAPIVKMVDNEYKAIITTKYNLEDKSENSSKKVDAALAAGLKDISEYKVLESRQVDSTISKGFKESSIYAVIFALLIIFFYIVLRFRKWQFGVGALVAMFHDVLIVLALFSIGHGIFPFAMEINQAFIAAILTVVGYSINDTVVVFDRIREYLTEKRREDSSTVINQALNSTLTRTVNTSVTTFLVLLIIFIFGGESIRGMTFALMIGVIVGTYSSLFIATPLVVDLSKKFDFKNKQKL